MTQQFVYDYIRSLDVVDELDDIDFSDRAFAYDYNEVQELFFDDSANNYVILAGRTGLRKKDMLGRICKDLLLRGVHREDVLYLDCECPLVLDADTRDVVARFVCERAESVTLYLLVNEIQEIGDWFGFISHVRSSDARVKLLCSSSTPPYIYEKMYDTGCPFCRVVVLSEKNDSNIKYETVTFGVHEEFKYNVKNGVVEIKGLTKEGKKMASHTVPAFIDGYPVEIIASGAFHDRSEMRHIDLPESISMIGDYAFSKCTGLARISLPEHLRYIGDHAFLGASSLSEIDGGDDVVHVGNSAFYGTPWAGSQGEFSILGNVLYRYNGDGGQVIIPANVSVLAPYSFADTRVNYVTSAHQVRTEEGVFYNCRDLEKVGFDLGDVPAFTFYGCRRLDCPCSVNVANKFAFYGCGSLKEASVNHAGVCSFAHCTSLKVINSLTEAEKGAFWNCTSLTELSACGIESVGECAFGRTGLRDVCVTAGFVGDCAFMDCRALSKVSFVNECVIGRAVIHGCGSVTEMNVPGRYKLMRYAGGYPEKLVRITVNGDVCDDFCRNCQTLREVTINGAVRFGRWCFYNNTSLSMVHFKDVENIGDWAFAYCNGILEVVLPETVTHVGMNAFRYCNNLKKIVLESKIPVEFGANAFYSTHPLKTFHVPEEAFEHYVSMKIWKEYLHLMQYW